MKILIIGAGQMARGVIHDFLRQNDLQKITVVDQSAKALDQTKNHFDNDSRIKCLQASAADLQKLKPLFMDADGVISAAPYDFNLNLTKLAIETHCHFIDLGGNNTVVDKQFKLNDLADKAGVGIIPDCGLAPGMVSVIAAHLVDEFARVDNLRIRVGGLPLHPQTPLNYMLVFSVHGLINEYLEPAVFLRDGEITGAPSMTEVEELEFPKPFGFMEAFITSGGASTLPKTFQNQIANLDYKTIRYPGHCHIMRAMLKLGFADNEPLNIPGTNLNLRDVFETMLTRKLSYSDEDVVLIRVSADGVKGGGRKSVRLQAVEYGDKKAGLSAMMRTTAFPAAIILQMLVRGKIKNYGVLRQERAVPTQIFMEELEKRGVRFERDE